VKQKTHRPPIMNAKNIGLYSEDFFITVPV